MKQTTVSQTFHPFQNAVLSFVINDLARDILFHEQYQRLRPVAWVFERDLGLFSDRSDYG